MLKMTLYLLSLFVFSSYSDEINFDELIYKTGLFYEKKTDQVFSGDVTGSQSGKILNGRKEGEWKGFYENGNLLWIGFYEKGLNDSKWIEYHQNGKIFALGFYENGNKTGIWTLFDKNGKKIAEEIYNKDSITTKIYK